MSNENRSKIANLTDEQIEQVIRGELDVGIRMGFELEFMKLDGKRTDDFKHVCECKGKPDRDAMKEAALNLLDTNLSSHLVGYFTATKPTRIIAEKLVRDMVAKMPCTFDRSTLLTALAEHVPSTKWRAITSYLNRLDDMLVETIIPALDQSKYIVKECQCTDTSSWGAMKKVLKTTTDMDVKQDGSVTGGEITSKGPNTVSKCLDLTKYLPQLPPISCSCIYLMHSA